MITRGIAATVVLAGGTALGLAVAAWADELNGSYAYAVDGLTEDTWTITPCGQGCAQVTTAGSDTAFPWTAQADLVNGQWVLTIDRQDGALCEDGSPGSATATYAWSPSTLDGRVVVTKHNGACGEPAKTYLPVAFTLTRT
jgi:hypothetical protein